MHLFPEDIEINVPAHFTDPFRYHPDPLVKIAAGLVIRSIKESEKLHSFFSEGKMLGVLVVSDKEGRIGYLAGFSGNAGGKSIIEGFVPPVYDLLAPSGHFKVKEAEISELNRRIKELEENGKGISLKETLSAYISERDKEITVLKAQMAISKRERDEIRCEVTDPSGQADLIRQSQYEKAELRRCRQKWEDMISGIKADIGTFEGKVRELKVRRSEMSDELQKWIFSQYKVHNRLGEEKSIRCIFEENGIIPPGGTGECAAPKMLEHAYRNGLTPIAMGEFWYGESPSTAVRTEGHFYPSCTSKCGPLLRFMTQGLTIGNNCTESVSTPGFSVIFEDDEIIVIDKPSGIPSVPGLDGRESILEKLEESGNHEEFHIVHRLDMDTSGIIIFAKNRKAAADLQKQFESHTINKTYEARLSYCPEGKELKAGDTGTVRLPLSADYDERPRQKVDKTQGKESFTEYEVLSVNGNGTIDILFRPHTGRTHQLRVHSAHISGLGHPILGDMLYGGAASHRLHLHARSISFTHPATKERMMLESLPLNHFDSNK